MNALVTEIISKRRDKLAIISQIIESSKKGISKTQVMYQANLSFNQLGQYLELMLKSELVEIVTDNDGKGIYNPTTKGIDFLRRYQDILKLLADNRQLRHVKPDND
ncbi:MAG: winged helix-turn-helix domain-containing protein [Candidatus Bathyarchaeota archaeon]|nr:winged helix-turn-helix domain-containing protein [Candidatus Bathyarchaeota archaeon]